MSATYPNNKIAQKSQKKNGTILAKTGSKSLYEIYWLKKKKKLLYKAKKNKKKLWGK